MKLTYCGAGYLYRGQPHNSFAHKKKYNEYVIDITFIFVVAEKGDGC